MGIYRGPGGTGDAVNDASSEALITLQAKDAALAAQAAAEAARDAALLAETNAETAEANAELAEANAEAAEAGVAASAAAAAASASSASSSASSASTSASNASTSASNAASSASAASTSASNALSSATNAAASAVAASTSAANAESSAADALAAQLAAEAALDQFDDTYLGAKSSNPTVDNDGNPLTTGDQYFNTVANELRIWNGSSWQAASTVGGTVSSLTVTGAFAANGSTTIGDAAGDSVTINASTVSTPNGLTVNGTVIPASKTLVVTTDIGSTVQAYDADTAKYDDVTANFTGTLQNGGSNVVVDSDIGVTVQAYDAQLADVAGLTPADNNFIVGNGTNFVTESGSTARTSLGLGSIATQDANNVTVTGGSINGTAIGGSTAAAGSFTSLTDSGNLTFTGTGNRITGDFSNSTAANRVAIQNSVTNANTTVGIIPNGTGTTATLGVESDSAYTNSSIGQLTVVGGSDVRIASSSRGSGTNLPLTMYTGGSERLRIDTSGNVGIGTTTAVTSNGTNLNIYGASASNLSLQNATSGTGNANGFQLIQDGLDTYVYNRENGAMLFATNNTERMRITSSGNVGIGESSPDTRVHIYGASTAGRGQLYIQGSGTVSRFTLANSSDAYALNTYGDSSTSLLTWDTSSGYSFRWTVSDAERMRIDSSGNVGIGTSSPLYRLDVLASGATSSANSFSIARITGASSVANDLTLVGPNTSQVRIKFGDTDNAGIGEVGYNHSTNAMRIVTNDAERMIIDSSGNVGIGTSSPEANAKLTVKGAGIAVSTDNSTVTPSGFDFKARSANPKLGLHVTNTGQTATLEFGTAGDNANGAFINVTGTDPLRFGTNNTERMRLSSGGNLGVGTSSPLGKFVVSNGGANGFEVNPDDAVGNKINSYNRSTSAYTTLQFDVSDFRVATGSSATERMRITSGGEVLIGTTNNSVTAGVGVKVTPVSGSLVHAVVVDSSSGTGISNYHHYNVNATFNGYRFYVKNNGGIDNFSANNTNLSDERVKTNIELAGNYLNKICSIPVKVFNYKDEPTGEQRSLGVIAQDVEAVAPELVSNDGWLGKDEFDTPLKSVYETDMMFALMKAIQEQQAIINELKTRIETLENK